jgi:pyruvyltransferase
MRFINPIAMQRVTDVSLEYARLLAHPRHICGYWWRGTPNFGDVLSPLVLNWASGRTVLLGENLPPYIEPTHVAIGSILDGLRLKNTVIWGSGLMGEKGRIAVPPQRICAVRGPLTRDALRAQGLRVPEVYGDPGVLVKRLFNPRLTREFKYGIVPHHLEKDLVPLHLTEDERVNVIDHALPPAEYVRQLCRCERILSSSLHGLVTADAFGIPSAHFSLSDRVLGHGFKFRDYYASVGRESIPPIDLEHIKDLEETMDRFALANVEPVIRDLMNASPFEYRPSVGPQPSGDGT